MIAVDDGVSMGSQGSIISRNIHADDDARQTGYCQRSESRCSEVRRPEWLAGAIHIVASARNLLVSSYQTSCPEDEALEWKRRLSAGTCSVNGLVG
jgi:hypothetical protein